MRIGPVLALAASAAVLAGCGAPAPVPDAPSADGTTYTLFAEAPDAIAVGLVMLAPEFLSIAASTAELIEIVPFVYAGAFVVVDADGAFSVPLPAADDVPASVMTPLADAVVNFAACTVDASPPAARASVTLFEGVTIPGLLAATAEGTALMRATDVERDPDVVEFDGTTYGWMFVDRDAQLGVSGCPYEADLELAEGWNQLAWTDDGATIAVAVVPETDVVAAVGGPFPPSVVLLGPDAE